ncbi:Olfactory receptor 2T2 [Heterocephalus glaber]|uniref:Olfactory receptor 2T2 n=1 Tax=Heterocephalus glaber TaxID=10181 RepID=G5BW71_HETGA|nr:Olfactory receptor 2T2 [Heterocephalus glaber]
MAYDRYVAVCSPLHYQVIVSHRVCLYMALGSWLGGSLEGFMLTPVTMSFPYCTSWQINHFFCEIPAVLQLSCMDTSLYETLMYACCMLMLLVSISIIAVSYTRILLTVHGMTSAEGQRRAWATCSSDVLVVNIFYGAAFYTNVLPHSYHTPEHDKAVSAFYTILTPMLNPLIYSLRNRDVATALRRVLGKSASPQRVRVKENNYRGHGDSVDQLCWHPSNPDLFVTASGDKTIRIWDVRTTKCIATVNTKAIKISSALSLQSTASLKLPSKT